MRLLPSSRAGSTATVLPHMPSISSDETNAILTCSAAIPGRVTSPGRNVTYPGAGCFGAAAVGALPSFRELRLSAGEVGGMAFRNTVSIDTDLLQQYFREWRLGVRVGGERWQIPVEVLVLGQSCGQVGGHAE